MYQADGMKLKCLRSKTTQFSLSFLFIIGVIFLTGCDNGLTNNNIQQNDSNSQDVTVFVKGYVTDGDAVPNANVQIYSPDGDSLGLTTTDSEGYYEFAALPEYEYYKATADYEMESKKGEIVQLKNQGTAAAVSCNLTPLTTLAVALGEQDSTSYETSKQSMLTWLGLDSDPFMDALNNEPSISVNLEAINYAMRSIPGGVSAWINSVIGAYNKDVNPNQMWIEDIGSSEPINAQVLWEDALSFNRGQTVKAGILMTLTAPNSAPKSRKFLYYRQSTDILNRDVFIHFTSPADIMNSTYLHNIVDGNHQTHVYLSWFKKLRRIVSSDFDQLFYSTDFTYEDIKFFTKGPYTASYPLEIEYNGQAAYVINITKNDSEYTSYSSIDVTVSKSSGLIVDARMYDKVNPNQLIKHLIFSDVQEIQGILTPMTTTMENLILGSKTELVVDIDYIEYNIDLPADTFTTRNMQK